MNEQLYIKKPNGRYEPINRAGIDFASLPTDKKVLVVQYKRNAKAFEYAPLDIDEEVLKHHAALRYFKSLFRDLLFEEIHPKLSWDRSTESTKPLTKEQLKAWDKLRSLFPNEDFSLLYSSQYDMIENALNKFIEKIKS